MSIRPPWQTAFLVLALGFGAVIGVSATVGSILLFALAAFLAQRMRPPALVTLAFAALWVSKPIVDLLDLPRFLEFVDLPLVGIALFVALVRPAAPADGPRVRLRVLLVPAIAIAVSTFINVDNPVRALAAGGLLLEPFLAIVAIDRAGISALERRRMGVVISALLLAQVPVALAQAVSSSNADYVRGTLTGAGAGAHVMGSVVLLGFLAIPTLLRRPAVLAAPLGLVAIAVAIVADAKTPLFALPFVVAAAAVFASIGRSPTDRPGARGAVVAGALLMVVALVLAARFVGFRDADAKVEAALTGPNSKVAMVGRIAKGLGGDPARLLYGFGPAQSVSRLALLASPSGFQAGSPVEVLGLSPPSEFDPEEGRVRGGPGSGTSLTSTTSSMIGVFGDFGILGFAAFAYAWTVVARAVWTRRGSWFVALALAGWLSLIPLGVAYDWPEQPPYTLLVALLVGLVVAPTREAPPRRTPTGAASPAQRSVARVPRPRKG